MKVRFSAVRTVVYVLCVLEMILAGQQMVYGGGMSEQAYRSPEYQARPTLATSLFSGDGSGMGEEAIQRVLASKFELPREVDVAILKIADDQQKVVRYYGYGYVRSEGYLKNQQALIDAVTEVVGTSKRVSGTTLLPSILTPKEPTLSLIRESAVRLQSDVILVFHLSSDIYEKPRFLKPNQAKGYCSCEGFLLDVRTGLIPFSRIVTRDFLATKEAEDASFNETISRAEREAALRALRKLGEDVVVFLDRYPMPAEEAQQSGTDQFPTSELPTRAYQRPSM